MYVIGKLKKARSGADWLILRSYSGNGLGSCVGVFVAVFVGVEEFVGVAVEPPAAFTAASASTRP